MTPLRIAQVINEPFGPESASGVQLVVYCLARALAESGQSVAVFSRESGIHVLRGAATPTGRHAGARQGLGDLVRARLLSRYLEHGLAEQVLAWQPDIVHFHSVHIPQNVALAAHLARAGIPYCVTTHGKLFRGALQRNRLKKIAFTLLFERRYFNDARFIQALSPHETDAIRQYGVHRPIVVVPNGLPPEADLRPSNRDTLFAERPWLRDRRIFMFIGRLDAWQKGLDLLIEAFARAGLRDAALVLVGPDHRGSRASLAALGDRVGLSSQLVFTGPAFGTHRANLLAAADMFVHPSRLEGLSLSVLAAAAAGKPCLVTREADPCGELERAQAALIVDASVPSIAAGLKKASTLNSNELRNMGAQASRVAHTCFTWPPIAERLLAAYWTALGGDENLAYDGRNATGGKQ
jgi:glycosyltransferase involved in cell wall biosynthesis